MFEFNLDWQQIVSNSIQLGIAFVLALPLGFDREANARSAGLRTFPLVAIGACGFMLTALSVLDDADARARVMYGIITGIGFIGGGSILKSDNKVVGTATAAGIWNTGAIGIAAAWGRYEIAIVICLVTFVTLSLGGWLKGSATNAD